MQTSIINPLFLWAAMLFGASHTALADPMWQDELNWLKIMAFAAHQTDYSGTFVYQYGNHVETSRITHVVDRDGEHGRLEGLDGIRREIIRNNDQVWCYLGSRKVKVEKRQGSREFPDLLPEQLSLLNSNYLIKQMEEDRVAGFHAHAVIFQPKDNLRYTHKMWAHSNSGLLLKAEVLDERGHVIEQNTFTQLTIGGNIDRTWIAADKPDASALTHTPHHGSPHKAEALTGPSGWQVDMLPPGFKKVTEMRRPLRSKKTPVIQMVFSDGLASISIFIETLDNNPEHLGLSSQGVIQVYSKVMDDYLLTVVGEVPPRTVILVADSIRHTAE